MKLTRFIKDKVFIKRTGFAVIAIPILAALVWLGNPWFAIFAVVWGICTGWEFYHIVRNGTGIRPLTYIGLTGILLFIINPYFKIIPNIDGVAPVSLLLAVLVIIPLAALLGRRNKENAFAAWGWTVSGVLYIGLLLSFYVELRNMENGMGWVYLAILVTFASDISAYLVGRMWGRHKLAPYVSPKNTWEGAVGAVFGAVIISLVIKFFFMPYISAAHAVLLGILISVIGQLGDLVKSLFKRNMTIKDSGKIFPGHGGFLDRTDSIAFAGALVYFFVLFA